MLAAVAISASIAILTSFCSIFLPRYSGVRPDHEPGNEHRENRVQQNAVETGADAAEDDFAGLDVEERHQTAERREAVVHGVHGAAAGSRGDDRKQNRLHDAEANFFPFHVAARLRVGCDRLDALGGENGIATLLGPVRREHADQKHDGHRSKERPSLPPILHHHAERVGEGGGNEEDEDDLKERGERSRVLERMRRVGVEETAAVRAELLDGFLRRDRTLRDHLRRAFERRQPAYRGTSSE